MKRYFFAFILLGALLLTTVPLLRDAAYAVNIGDPFPLFDRPHTLTEDHCAYLKIDCGSSFRLADLSHDVIIIEFLNVYCHTCRMQVNIFNELYQTIENDPQLQGKVCIIGIAVGNDAEEVTEFQRMFGSSYPIVTDPEKAIFNQTGNTRGTPHTYILRKEERRFIIDYHAGGVTTHTRYLSTIKHAMRGRFLGTEPGNKCPPYSFTADKKSYTHKDFLGKKALLYFPCDQQYSLEIDTRIPENQLYILDRIRTSYPDMLIVVFPFNGLTLPADLHRERFVFADADTPDSEFSFKDPENPVVYYINEYGRIGYKGDAITFYNATSILKGREYTPSPDMSPEEIVEVIETAIRTKGHTIESTEKVIMDNGEGVYVSALSPKRSGRYLFSRVESRPSLCDICHDSHFIYVLNQKSIITDFIPLELTKYGNISWDADDVKKIRDYFAGQSIFDDFSFDPETDAVTAATMSSSLVFESFNKAKNVFEGFKQYKFRSGHWEKLCFRSICRIREKLSALKEEDDSVELTDDLLQQIIAGESIPECPLGGMYIVVDGSVLCSIHGLNTEGCTDNK